MTKSPCVNFRSNSSGPCSTKRLGGSPRVRNADRHEKIRNVTPLLIASRDDVDPFESSRSLKALRVYSQGSNGVGQRIQRGIGAGYKTFTAEEGARGAGEHIRIRL